MTNTFRRRIVLLGMLAAPFVAMPLLAQSPTPEGTVITNTATASFTDANNNTYSNVTASTSITVGLKLGVTVTTSAATQTPASPSTGNTVTFTIANSGNANKDTVQVTNTLAAGITVSQYVLTVNGSAVGTYATLAALNTALATAAGNGINYASTATVAVTYDVASGKGGATLPITLTATSQRDPGNPAQTARTGSATTNVQPPVNVVINTTPDAQAVSRLPSNGTQYTEVFTVQNNGNASDNISLAGSQSGGILTIVSVNGTAGASSSVTVASGSSASVNVVYTVANGAAAGATGTLTLTATSGNDNTKNDPGSYVVTVIRSAVTITKVAYKDDQTTAIGASKVLPGDFVQYKITVTNGGAAAASTVSVTDPLAAQLTYDSATGDLAGWSFTPSGGGVQATLSGTLAAGASRFFWVRAQVK